MIIVDFEADTPLLRETRATVPEMDLVLEDEQAPGGGDDDPIRLLFWASNGDFESLESALADDPTVTRPAVLADIGDRRLYRVCYTDEGMAMTPHSRWVELDASLVRATSTPNGWEARMRFPNNEAVVELQSWFQDRDLPFNITGLFQEESPSKSGSGPALTEKQRQALLTAWKRGYFSVPSRTNLEELGDELDISDSAVSQRIRRGLEKLLEFHYDADSPSARE